jgi:hypothetical protein
VHGYCLAVKDGSPERHAMVATEFPNFTTQSTSAINEDRVLLEGPHSRTKELWLVLRAVRDFINGFRTLHFVGPCVTVFGSARYHVRSPSERVSTATATKPSGLCTRGWRQHHGWCNTT